MNMYLIDLMFAVVVCSLSNYKSEDFKFSNTQEAA